MKDDLLYRAENGVMSNFSFSHNVFQGRLHQTSNTSLLFCKWINLTHFNHFKDNIKKPSKRSAVPYNLLLQKKYVNCIFFFFDDY